MIDPLDKELRIETRERIKAELAHAEAVLRRKYDLPRVGFPDALAQRLASEEIVEEPDVVRWQSLYAALLDWSAETPA